MEYNDCEVVIKESTKQKRLVGFYYRTWCVYRAERIFTAFFFLQFHSDIAVYHEEIKPFSLVTSDDSC
jgi:hypothetical protein